MISELILGPCVGLRVGTGMLDLCTQSRDTYRTEADDAAEAAALSGSAPPLPPQEPAYAITFSSDGELDGADQVRPSSNPVDSVWARIAPACAPGR
jgi:hypothetical protein